MGNTTSSGSGNRLNTPIGKHSGHVKILGSKDHILRRNQLSENALKVVHRLAEAGHKAYLVGGCVRDGLLGLDPKDFDVATSATPDEVRALFRNARIIGRRFRIVHVCFGREIIEVTTFRGQHSGDEGDHRSQQSEDGMLLRDNVWGSVDQDALRRDFTVNALYYNPIDGTIHDWAGGIDDMEGRCLRLIGKPEVRYREDPVRMLRAVRFAAKLNFELEEETAEPIHLLAPMLLQVPPARLFEEVLKLFLSGKALATYLILREQGLFAMLFPATFDALSVLPWAEKMIRQALKNTDARLAEGKPVTPAFLYAALLWPAVVMESMAMQAEGMAETPANQQAAHATITRQLQHTSIPKRFSLPMRDIWDMQQRLPRRRGKRADLLLENPRFRASYDFLLLREIAGELEPGLGEWWTQYQTLDEHGRREMIAELPQTLSKASGGRSRRRRRPPRKEQRPS